jgi:hypothetical protein
VSGARGSSRPPDIGRPVGGVALGAVLAIGRLEAVRLARHPLPLLGAALGLLLMLTQTQKVSGAFQALSGYALLPLAGGTCAAAHLLASRERRDRTGELCSALPVRAHLRAVAMLLALAGPLALAVVVLSVGVVASSAWDGVPVPIGGVIELLRPAPVELAQGVLTVALLGTLGLLLGSWVPTRALGPVILVGVALLATLVAWSAEGWFRWLLPVTHHERAVLGWVQAEPGWGYSVVSGFDRVAMGWHVAYLAALTTLLGCLLVVRHRRTAVLAGATVAVAVAAGALSVLQVP